MSHPRHSENMVAKKPDRARKVKRYGQLIGLKPGSFEEYAQYHANVWPEVLRAIRGCHIQNYSIFFRDDILFAYFEYVGDDFDQDMAKLARNPKMQEWWAIMKTMQQPATGRKDSDWWADMTEVFHCD